MMRLRHARGKGGKPASDKIDRGYFENYRGLGPYSEVWSRFTDPAYLSDLIKIVLEPGEGLQAAGGRIGSGEFGRSALRERGIDAWGIEKQPAIHSHTPKQLRSTTSSDRSSICRLEMASSISCSRPACATSRSGESPVPFEN